MSDYNDNEKEEEPLVIRLLHANRKLGREGDKGIFELMRLITKVANERQEEAAIKKGLDENLKPIEYYQEQVVKDLKDMSNEVIVCVWRSNNGAPLK